MANFSAGDVKTLRERTSCGMMDCKKALTEADGDMEKAVELLREKGLAASEKKAGRIAAEGAVAAITNDDGTVGAVVEVNAETDFVAKNDKFMAFVSDVAKTVISQKPADLDALLAMTVDGRSASVEEELRELILVIGENMKVRRFERCEGNVVTYVHAGGRIGVMVDFAVGDAAATKSSEYNEMAQLVAMQIAAMNPAFLDESKVPAEILEHEKSILLAQMDNDPANAKKPANVKEQMIVGKIKKYLKENCLVDQASIADSKSTVAEQIAAVAKALNTTITINSFTRFEKGEGIEKKEENFADEVASMMN